MKFYSNFGANSNYSCKVFYYSECYQCMCAVVFKKFHNLHSLFLKYYEGTVCSPIARRVSKLPSKQKQQQTLVKSRKSLLGSVFWVPGNSGKRARILSTRSVWPSHFLFQRAAHFPRQLASFFSSSHRQFGLWCICAVSRTFRGEKRVS